MRTQPSHTTALHRSDKETVLSDSIPSGHTWSPGGNAPKTHWVRIWDRITWTKLEGDHILVALATPICLLWHLLCSCGVFSGVTLKVPDYAKLTLVMFSNNDVSPSVNELLRKVHSSLLLLTPLFWKCAKNPQFRKRALCDVTKGTDTSSGLVTTQPGVGSIP